MEPQLTSLIINTAHPVEMLEFYGRLGLHFETKKISKGGQCHKAFIGPVELSLFEAHAGAPFRAAPDVQLTFRIMELDKVVRDLSLIKGVECLMDPTLLPEGKKAILLDPDGRAIELIEMNA
ncbi:MAG: VOC family protein [Bdellovibrionaceae bacterium]|nr:VOC family protein [Pseudobdellovibrionaceae bacterium]